MSQEIYEEFFSSWVLLHRTLWSKYESNPSNKITLLNAASKFRPCLTAFDRAFADSKTQLVRSDGHDVEWDAEQAAQREAAQEENVVVTSPDFEYAASLSPTQLAEAYRADPEFALKYRKLIRDHGFRPVPVFSKRGL